MKFIWYMMCQTSSDIDVELFSSKKKLNERIEILLKEFYDYSRPVKIKRSEKSFSVYEEDEMLIAAEYGKKLIQ